MDEKHPDETQRMIEAVEKAADYKRKEQWWYLFFTIVFGFGRFVLRGFFHIIAIVLVVAGIFLLSWFGNWLFELTKKYW